MRLRPEINSPPLCTGVELFLGSKVLCLPYFEICAPSLFSPSPLWSVNFKTKHALNLWLINNSSPVQYYMSCQVVGCYCSWLAAKLVNKTSWLNISKKAFPWQYFSLYFCWHTCAMLLSTWYAKPVYCDIPVRSEIIDWLFYPYCVTTSDSSCMSWCWHTLTGEGVVFTQLERLTEKCQYQSIWGYVAAHITHISTEYYTL